MRRSWRIGQSQPVLVVFMAYRNTLQADALKLVAKKLPRRRGRAARRRPRCLRDEHGDAGDAGDAGDDLMLALARKIVAGEADDADSVESVFAQAQQVAAEAEALLVDAEFVAEAPAKPLRGRRGQAHGPRIAQLFVWIGKPVTPSCAQLSTAELLGRSPWYSSGLGTLLLSIGDALPGARGRPWAGRLLPCLRLRVGHAFLLGRVYRGAAPATRSRWHTCA